MDKINWHRVNFYGKILGYIIYIKDIATYLLKVETNC